MLYILRLHFYTLSFKVYLLLCVLCVCVCAGFQQVTCGSVVKIANVDSSDRLHSHDVKYGSGSGQQVHMRVWFCLCVCVHVCPDTITQFAKARHCTCTS